MKIFCVLAAVVIWIQVASSRMLTREVELPLSLTGLPAGTTLAGNHWPESVRVRATGSKWQFFTNQFLGRGLGRVEVDLSEVRPGALWQRDVTVNDVESTLTDVGVHPPVRLSLVLDRIVTRRLPVRIATVGAVPDGRILLGAVRAEPDSVDVTGPAARLEPLDEPVATEPFDLSRIRGSQDVERALVSPGEGLSVDPMRIRIAYRSAEAVARTFEHVPVVPLVDQGQPTVEIFPPVASVAVVGPRGEVEELPMSSVSLTVALSGLGTGTHTLEPDVLLPEHLSLVSLEPARVLVVIGGAGRTELEQAP